MGKAHLGGHLQLLSKSKVHTECTTTLTLAIIFKPTKGPLRLFLRRRTGTITSTFYYTTIKKVVDGQSGVAQAKNHHVAVVINFPADKITK